MTTNYPIAAHGNKRTIVPQCGWRCSRHWWKVRYQGLCRASGHVRIPFKVLSCGVHYSEGRANDQYTGLGRRTRFGSLSIGLDMLWETLTLHILPCIHHQTVCSCPLFGGFIWTDRRAKSMTRRLRPSLSTYSLTTSSSHSHYRSGGRSFTCEGLSLTDMVLSPTWNQYKLNLAHQLTEWQMSVKIHSQNLWWVNNRRPMIRQNLPR